MVAANAKVGVAVSGGPDSLALLLLCEAARPGRIDAATVDHGLRPESDAEAAQVAQICKSLGVPHSTLTPKWNPPPSSNVPAAARDARYALLASWARDHGLNAVATAHHVDDQAETVLMRLARGSGVRGLAGMSGARMLDARVMLLRPLLNWRRSELGWIVQRAGLAAIEDPTNVDPKFDRTRARALLSDAEWLDPVRLASAASHCRDADTALAWCAAQEFEARAQTVDAGIRIDPSGLPVELQRRLLLIAMERLGAREPRGPDAISAVERLASRETITLGGIKMEGGDGWHLSVAAPRRNRID